MLTWLLPQASLCLHECLCVKLIDQISNVQNQYVLRKGGETWAGEPMPGVRHHHRGAGILEGI